MKLSELRQERDALMVTAKQLNDKATAARRDMTADEQVKFDKIMVDVRLLNGNIRLTEEGGDDWDEKSQGTRAAQYEGYGGYLPGGGGDFSGEGEVRFLTREQRLTDLAPRGERFDIGKGIRGKLTGNWKNAESEKRALMESGDTQGGFLIPELVSAQVIDYARNNSVVMQAGTVTIPMDGPDLRICKLSGDPVGHWRGEGVAIVEDDAMAFESVTLRARTLGCLIRCSVELMEDSPNFGQLVQSTMAKAMAVEVDRVALVGIGAAEEPLGVYEVLSGAQVRDMGAAAGHALTGYDDMSIACRMVMDYNGTPSSVIMSPREWGYLDVLKDGEGNYLLQPPESWKSLKKLVTSQIPKNQIWGSAQNGSFAVVGDWTGCFFGTRRQITLEISRVAGDAFSKLQVFIRAYLRADFAFVRPQHLVVIKGIIPAA
jgi:HK97 family phage major capsid protein